MRKVFQKNSFFFCYLLSRLGDEVLVFLIPLLAYTTTGDVSKSGLLLTAEWIPRLIALNLVGPCVDRYGAKRLVMAADFLRFILLVSSCISLLFYYSQVHFHLLIAMSVFIGIATEISYVATEVLIVRDLPTHAGNSQKLTQSIDQLARVLAPALAIWAHTKLALSSIFVWTALFVFLNLLAVSVSVPYLPVSRDKNNSSYFCLGFFLISTDSVLRSLSSMAFVANLAFGIALSTLSYFVIGVFGHSESMVGYVVGMSAFVSIITLYSLRGSLTTHHQAAMASLVFIAALIGLRFAPNFPVFALSYVFFGSAAGVLSLYVRSVRATVCSKDVLGRVTGIMVFINSASYPISGFLVFMFGQAHISQVLNFIIVVVCIQMTLFLKQILNINF